MSLESARRVLRIEAEAIRALIERLDESLLKALDILQGCAGRIVLTGMGKSGFIARKTAATLASTTAALAMGDAVAVALLERRGIRPEDFALIHPGGTLGRKLLLKMEDLMHQGDAVPRVSQDLTMREAIPIISGKRLGMTAVTDGDRRLTGIITDGDLRRALQQWPDLLERPVHAVMTRRPKRIGRNELAAKAVQVMEQHGITSLLIVDATERVEGVIHLHDLLRAWCEQGSDRGGG